MDKKRTSFIAALAFTMVGAVAGPYAPGAGQAGTTAVAFGDPLVVGWATSVTDYSPGADVDAIWQEAGEALGPAEGNALSVVSLGRGGTITLGFDAPIANGPGPDFAVFENGLSNTFLELAFVEVSSDGVHFFRFDSRSETASAVGPFGGLDPTNVDGLAGKYRAGFGTPFDLSALPVTASLDPAAITHVRLVDVIGGTSLDGLGRVIYDPFATTGSAGFDLDGIAVLRNPPARISIIATEVSGGMFRFTWTCDPGRFYRVECFDPLLAQWQEQDVLLAEGTALTKSVALVSNGARIYRVVGPVQAEPAS